MLNIKKMGLNWQDSVSRANLLGAYMDLQDNTLETRLFIKHLNIYVVFSW